MEFWGAEVKCGESFEVNPGLGKILHLSQATLGESKKGKGSDSVPLTLKFGDQKLILGTLSQENFPQLTFDLVFEKTFQLSHNWKNGSVYFCGYKTVIEDNCEFSDYSDSEEDVPLQATENGKPKNPVIASKGNNSKPESSSKAKVKPSDVNKDVKPVVDEDDSDDMDDSDLNDSDDEDMSDSQIDDSEGDDSSEEDEDTPKKEAVAAGKKNLESATKTPPAKKAKLTTPQKTDGKKDGRVATPYPSKQAGKNTADASKSKTQTTKSGGDVKCNSCTRTFKSEASRQAHAAAKHGNK